MRSRARITTPEGITFSLATAGPVSRFLAVSVDIACVSLLAGIFDRLMGVLGLISEDWSLAVAIIAYFVIFMGFSMAFEWFRGGRTPGKYVTGLRVIDADGLRLLPVQIVMRNLFRLFDMLPVFYGLGGVVCLLNPRRQRLGDIAANTIVIRDRKLALPDMRYLETGKFNSFRDHPQLVARLRQKTSPEEAYLAAAAIARRDEMDADARGEVFREFAAHFRAKVVFPDEAVEGLSNEQYVRNVADVLMAQSRM